MDRFIVIGILIIGFAMVTGAYAEHSDERLEIEVPTQLEGSCGDGQCRPPEDCNTCPRDCGQCCGNSRCEPPEDCRSCPQDCGPC